MDKYIMNKGGQNNQPNTPQPPPPKPQNPEISKEKYQLVIRVPLECIDTVQARNVSKDFLKSTGLKYLIPHNTINVKLQKINSDSEPEGILFEID